MADYIEYVQLGVGSEPLPIRDPNAARAGYGFGEKAVNITELVYTRPTTDAELSDTLEAVYATMDSNGCIFVQWKGYPTDPTSSSHSWFGILSKSSANNGNIVAWSAFNFCTRIIKVKNSTWQDMEYIDPPMKFNTPYRTTERFKNKPVYTMLLDFGTSANQKSIGINLKIDTYMIIRYAATLDGEPLPYHYTDTSQDSWVRVYLGSTAYNAMLHTPYTGLSNAHVQIWYCEK